MTFRACSEQPDILDAASAGRDLPAAVAAHLASCPSCREQVEVVRVIRGLAETPDAAHPLPDPGVIWWKAQLLRRWQAERAASAPIERMRWVELAAGFACLAVFLAWQWQGLVSLVARAVPAGFAAASAAASAPEAVSPPMLLLMLGATASIGLVVLAALHRRLGRAPY